MVPFKALQALFYGILREPALSYGDHGGGETAHHVVTERRGSNREPHRGGVVGTHPPLVLQPLPARADDVAKQGLAGF